jgi:hypothetical protein
MKALCRPRTSSELAIVESLLNAENIRFFVHNEHFGGLRVGPSMPLFNERTVLVEDEDYERAAALIAEPPPPAEPAPPHERVSVLGRLRMVLEFLLFGWFLPGQRRRHATGE